MLTARVTFDDGIVDALTREVGNRMERCANLLAEEIRKKIGRRYPPASKPDEPPRMRSGDLLRSVKVWNRQGKWEVIVRADHAGPLERGTGRMEARPFFRSTITEVLAVLRELMRRPM